MRLIREITYRPITYYKASTHTALSVHEDYSIPLRVEPPKPIKASEPPKTVIIRPEPIHEPIRIIHVEPPKPIRIIEPPKPIKASEPPKTVIIRPVAKIKNVSKSPKSVGKTVIHKSFILPKPKTQMPCVTVNGITACDINEEGGLPHVLARQNIKPWISPPKRAHLNEGKQIVVLPSVITNSITRVIPNPNGTYEVWAYQPSIGAYGWITVPASAIPHDKIKPMPVNEIGEDEEIGLALERIQMKKEEATSTITESTPVQSTASHKSLVYYIIIGIIALVIIWLA